MRRVFLLLFITTGAYSQTIDRLGRTLEQNALDYLVCNFSVLELAYEHGCFMFNPDSNAIWYKPKVFNKRHARVRIQKGVQATEDQFHYWPCDKKDIFIMTFPFRKTGNGYEVHFDIVTQTNHFTGYTVLIDKELHPYKISNDDVNTGQAGTTYSCNIK